jgi:hypothetical protein
MGRLLFLGGDIETPGPIYWYALYRFDGVFHHNGSAARYTCSDNCFANANSCANGHSGSA